jgi:hypothetical protein
MSNQDDILNQNAVFARDMGKALEMVKAAPGGMTPEVLTFFETALEAHVEWMASHDILFPDEVMGR